MAFWKEWPLWPPHKSAYVLLWNFTQLLVRIATVLNGSAVINLCQNNIRNPFHFQVHFQVPNFSKIDSGCSFCSRPYVGLLEELTSIWRKSPPDKIEKRKMGKEKKNKRTDFEMFCCGVFIGLKLYRTPLPKRLEKLLS